MGDVRLRGSRAERHLHPERQDALLRLDRAGLLRAAYVHRAPSGLVADVPVHAPVFHSETFRCFTLKQRSVLERPPQNALTENKSFNSSIYVALELHSYSSSDD